MSVRLLFNSIPQFSDSAGVPLSGGKLYTYIAGSSTPADTYTTSGGTVAQANPIILNSRGEPDNAIWGTTGVLYKLVLKTSADAAVWTIDNVSPINDTSVAQSEWIPGPTPTYISGTSFSLVGDQTATFQVGRRVKTTNSGGTVYGSIFGSAFTSVTTVTVVNDSGALDSGLSAVSYGLLSPANGSVPVLLNGDFAFNDGINVANGITTTQLSLAPGSGATFGLMTIFETGSFTATITGMTATVTATATYVLAGGGQSQATINIPLMTGTSNATTCTITGAPAKLQPATIKYLVGRTQDNGGAYAAALVQVETSGVLTLFKDVAGTAFTNSGTKSSSGSSYTYLLS